MHKKINPRKIILVFGIIVFNNLQLAAQEQWVFDSENLSKQDTVLVFKPAMYNLTKSYPLVYLLHGYSENYEQWSNIIDCQRFADEYNMIIVVPDGFASWYIDSPYKKESQMERFFFEELVPKIHNSYNIDEKNIFISGLSMGGYGALRHFLSHQDYFNSAGSTSGAFIVDFDFFKEISLSYFGNTRITDDLTDVFGDHKKNNWSRYDISTLLKEQKHTKPFILDCGTEDVLYQSTLQVKRVADSLNIPITFISQPGNHHVEYWKKSIAHHFVYFRQQLIK